MKSANRPGERPPKRVLGINLEGTEETEKSAVATP
jgi:hypothetical protein